MQEAAPGAQAMHSQFEPAAGAVFLALELAGIEADAVLRERLETTLPGTAFFST
jgi:hypothetical protein